MWKERTDLIGYYNEFTKKFNETEFLRALYTTTYRKDLDVIVLDERNLARIEYYFAEFLSIMEMRDPNDWQIDLIPDVVPNDPLQFKNGKLLIPQNVEFFGTANNDDSTFTISDKVYDRAISIFFDDKGRAFEAEDQDARHIPAFFQGLHRKSERREFLTVRLTECQASESSEIQFPVVKGQP